MLFKQSKIVELDKRVAVQDDRIKRMDSDIKALTASVNSLSGKVDKVMHQLDVISVYQSSASEKLTSVDARLSKKVESTRDFSNSFELSNRIFWGAAALIIIAVQLIDIWTKLFPK